MEDARLAFWGWCNEELGRLENKKLEMLAAGVIEIIPELGDGEKYLPGGD